MPLNHAKIRRRREALKLTQEQAAAAAGITRPSWSRIEAGNRPDPSLSTAEKIAAALKVKIDQLLDR